MRKFASSFSEKVTPLQAVASLSEISLQGTSLANTCPVNPNCGQSLRSPFRTLDGSCNNVAQTILGRSSTQYQRLLDAEYNDGNIFFKIGLLRLRTYQFVINLSILVVGVTTPRKAKDGDELPR